MAHPHLLRLAPDCIPIASSAGAEKILGRTRLKNATLPLRRWKRGMRMERLSRRWRGRCVAGLEDDLPIAIAIGACVASSLFLPPAVSDTAAGSKNDVNGGADEIRSAAMGIISFIPFFNWLAWVFAWLDTRRTRYLVYAVVYAAPYLKNDFSLSPDDSWLPLASLAACIVHVQLDTNNASIELADNESSLSSSKKVSGSSLLDVRPLEQALGTIEKFFGSAHSDDRKRQQEAESENDVTSDKETLEWPKRELQDWDQKLASSQRKVESDEVDKRNSD